MDLSDGLLGFDGIQVLRQTVALLAWCYRTAYSKVFYLQDVDQLLFK